MQTATPRNDIKTCVMRVPADWAKKVLPLHGQKMGLVFPVSDLPDWTLRLSLVADRTGENRYTLNLLIARGSEDQSNFYNRLRAQFSRTHPDHCEKKRQILRAGPPGENKREFTLHEARLALEQIQELLIQRADHIFTTAETDPLLQHQSQRVQNDAHHPPIFSTSIPSMP